MTECRRLLCFEEATHLVTVWLNGNRRDATYCEEHMNRARRAVSRHPELAMAQYTPIEKGTTVTYDDNDRDAAEIDRLSKDLASARQRIVGLEGDITRQGQVLAARNEKIREKDRANAEQAQRIIDLDDLINQQQASIASRDRIIALLKNEKAALGSTRDALIRLLHEIANEAEGEPLSDNIDERLEELDLPSRKKHYEMLFTVPVQMRVEGDYTSATAMREAFDAGEIDWNVADYEGFVDEIKVGDIVELEK